MAAMETEEDQPEVTAGERAAGVAGAVCGLLILAVCVDLATGGRLSGAIMRRGGPGEPASPGTPGAGGGCGCD